MCKHKSGSSRSQQTSTSSSNNEERQNAEMKATTSGGKMECGGNVMVECSCPSIVPVHQPHPSGSSFEENRQLKSYCKRAHHDNSEGGDDCNESSPMLIVVDDQLRSSAGASCALQDCEKPACSDTDEGNELLSNRADAELALNASNKNKQRKQSRWKSGVVVYPSNGSLTTEWKDDVSPLNSLTNLDSSLLPSNFDDIYHPGHTWYGQNSKIYNLDMQQRSISLLDMNNSFVDQYPNCSNNLEYEAGVSDDKPLTISPSPFLHHKLVKGLQFSSSVASSLTDGGNMPICKICHLPSSNGDPLISPCRCSGTMQFIHCNCLMKWLEYSSKRTRRPPTCELCQYQYHWHKKFKVGRWQFPHCSHRDKLFHITFFLALMVMIACATITILCFKQDKGIRISQDSTELTESEIVTLVCGVLFFIAFFLAMYVEVKARNNVYRLFVKFLYLNQQWYFDEYEKKDNGVVSV